MTYEELFILSLLPYFKLFFCDWFKSKNKISFLFILILLNHSFLII